MTTDEHQRERIRAWVAFACTPDGDSDRFNAEFADGMLAEFDKRFPAPSAAAPVEPDQSAMGMAVSSLILDQTAELAALRQKARLWDAVASGKVRLEFNGDCIFIAWFGPFGRGTRTEGFPTAEEAVEAAIAAGALK